jgi:subtilisin family serine protease
MLYIIYSSFSTGLNMLQAIMRAVNDWKAHIIVMPFAFPHRNEDIADAVDHADSHKVLLFAAASNRNDLKLGFPACLPEVICIYSNKTSTIPSTFCRLGKERKNNFSTIGDEVEGAWPLHLNDGKETKRETGTSCSTPIAAGVAALILEYATQNGRHRVTRAKELKKKLFMEKVLFKCMTEGSTAGVYNLIEPWKLLSNYDGKQAKTLPMISNSISERIKELSSD